jgi:peptidyl-prolyl cis-trans isomerase SurA
MNKLRKTLILTVLTVLLNSPILFSQIKSGIVLDKVIARVGRMEILKSDIDARLLVAKQQNPSLDIEDKATRDKILNSVIDEKLIIEKALRDSIPVADNQITQRWKAYLRQMVAQYGSEERIEQLYGTSIAELRSKTQKQIRDMILSEGLIGSKFTDIKVNNDEVNEFFNEYKDSLPNVPTSVELFHITKNVIVKETKKADVMKMANTIRDSILNGGDFEEFAKRHSQDIYSKNDGGNLGWFESSKLFPEFVKAAAALQSGEVSLPIETPLGYHLIQTIEKTSEKLNTRHILFKIGKTDNDKAVAMDFLKKIKDSVSTKYPFEEFAKRYSDDTDTKGFGGSLGNIPLAQLPGSMAAVVSELKDGEISDPIPFQTDSYQIIYKKSTIPEHKPNLKDDFKTLEQFAKMKKKDNEMKKFISKLRKEIYWELID